MSNNETKEKKTKAVKKKAVQKPAEDLVLKNTIAIPGIAIWKDGEQHFVKGQNYPAGTVVTEEMVDAYEASRIKVGGTTPITSFCN